MGPTFILTLMASALSLTFAKTQNDTEDPLKDFVTSRDAKALSVFQVVKFPNIVCASTTTGYNGTCYTSSECNNKGGTSSGSCASGFGVCCVFSLSCGGSAAENCTYIVQSSATSVTSPCTYKICPCNSNICRLRFDFTSFVIADPVTTPAITTLTMGGTIGDCVTDMFSITSPGNRGTPVICGFNTGQHMIVDANTQCHFANFAIGSTTTTSRQWTIKVTQHACGSEFTSGPPNCLQYFSGTTGVISSYNFPTTSSTIPLTATHLSNQCYEICLRRESGYCSVCLIPVVTSTTPQSFGLSISNDPTGAAVITATDSSCITDYLIIPGAMSSATAGIALTPAASKICGRLFHYTSGIAAPTAAVSVCTRQVPFRITFKTDADEANVGAANTFTNELITAPLGSIGFSLRYVQSVC